MDALDLGARLRERRRGTDGTTGLRSITAPEAPRLPPLQPGSIEPASGAQSGPQRQGHVTDKLVRQKEKNVSLWQEMVRPASLEKLIKAGHGRQIPARHQRHQACACRGWWVSTSKWRSRPSIIWPTPPRTRGSFRKEGFLHRQQDAHVCRRVETLSYLYTTVVGGPLRKTAPRNLDFASSA